MEQVKDPVCGRTIDRERTATQARFAGRIYFFCSNDCARAFNSDPARYAGEQSSVN